MRSYTEAVDHLARRRYTMYRAGCLDTRVELYTVAYIYNVSEGDLAVDVQTLLTKFITEGLDLC